ncbi:MAG TPA: DUF695 domain-containing protein [Candidatus Acidoferrales bacterium]|nr:DUF695 domain-containing protein [Candidatus Acidoferrales bacterium]
MKFLNRLFGRNDRNEMPPDELNHWVMAEVENAEARVVYRLRTTKPPIADIGSYATGISIRWNYEGGDSGMPPSDVNAQQLVFEAAIEELTSYNGYSFLMLVSTGMDFKEWLFYAKDRGEFMSRLNSALGRHPNYPLKTEFYDDAEWKIWNDIVGIIGRERN